MTRIKRSNDKPLARVLPVVKVETTVAQTSSCGRGRIVLNIVSVGSSRRSTNGIISIEMNSNLKRNCPRACSSMSSLRGCSSIEENSTNSVDVESASRPSTRLKGRDVQIVSKTGIAANCSGQSGSSSTNRSNGICLDRSNTSSTHTVGGGCSSGRGRNRGRVTD